MNRIKNWWRSFLKPYKCKHPLADWVLIFIRKDSSGFIIHKEYHLICNECGHIIEEEIIAYTTTKYKRCKVCKKKAYYKEFSPDGPPYYFCSKKCFKDFKKNTPIEKLMYRASPLSKINEDYL